MKCKGINFEKLEVLDLKRKETIGEIVEGMSKCSFGARCLGDTTAKIQHIVEHNLTRDQSSGVIVYDGEKDGSLGRLTQMFAQKNSFELMTAQEYTNADSRTNNLIVLGRFSPRDEKKLFRGGEHNTIFINNEGISAPGQVRDGYFPNVIFSDPAYVLPIIDSVLDERFDRRIPETSTHIISRISMYGGQAELVAEGARNLLRMVDDPTYTLLFTMSGAMTIAQMGLVLTDMIEQEMIQSVTTTGAAMAHGLVASTGLSHYKHHPDISDAVLAKIKGNRVTDTIEPETNFDHIDEILHKVLLGINPSRPISPSEFHAKIGAYLAQHHPHEPGILKAAYQKGVPVFVPAFYDSELGNDVTTHNIIQGLQHKKKIRFDIEKDNLKLIDFVQNTRRMGIFSVGGGVPRNWTQNIAPLLEIAKERTGLPLKEKMYSSGIRIAPDEMHYGHLGGCTYAENMSWRKMDPNGVFVQIKGDATISWPFMIKYVMENRA